MPSEDFLNDLDLQPLNLAEGRGLEPLDLAVRPGSGGLEVAAPRAGRKPGQETMRNTWTVRRGGWAAPVLLVVFPLPAYRQPSH